MALLIEGYDKDITSGSGCVYNEIEAKLIVIGDTVARDCTATEE